MELFGRQVVPAFTGWVMALVALLALPVAGVPPHFKSLPAFLPPVPASRSALGDLPATNRLTLALGLPLHHRDQLNALLAQLYDPHSTNFHRFLAPAGFAARFGPTPEEYQAVVAFAESQGLTVVGRHRNRLVLDVAGAASDIGRAFQVHLRSYRHPTEHRNYFAPDGAPLVPANLPVADIWGLTDYARPRPQTTLASAAGVSLRNLNGSAPNGLLLGSDFRHAYAPGTVLNGAGQSVALVEFDGYYPVDITNYESLCGYAPVSVQNVYLDGVDGTPGYSQIGNAVLEVSLDIEMAIAMAPGLSQVLVYEGNSPYDVYNAIATDDTARQISSSWIMDTGPSTDWTGSGGTLDSILSEMVAQGQSFFQACGDSDAYTGGQTLNGTTGPIPADSIYVVSVGGTSLNMTGRGAQYSSETVWNWGNNTGTGGGISTNYPIPSWQAAVNMSTNEGSSVNRNIPDVALTADGIYEIYNNGNSTFVGGTSCAAPLWAGFCALINQQSVGTTPGGPGVGFLNPALYAIGTGSNYPACFNDITVGDNVGDNTPGLYEAVPGYDLCTGWGTPAGTNLINALAPLALPFFLTQPVAVAAVSGTNVSFAATVSGAAPISLQWQLNGVNLVDDDIVTGSASSLLSLTAVTTNNAGNYTLVITNAFGAVTSAVAPLTVNLIPATGALISSRNPSGYQDAISFAADILPASATGTVAFYTNGEPCDLEPLVGGEAVSTNIDDLPRGTNLIMAVYSGDANDLGFTNTFYQVVTNHPPTALAANLTRAAGVSLVIAVTNLAADWSDVDGDAVSLAGVTTSTNGVTVMEDGSGSLVYVNSNNVPDQFSCIITDGFGGTNYQPVNIAVVFPRIGAVPGNNNAGGGITLDLTGFAGQTYVLETATNLTPPVVWLPVATNTLDTNGDWQFTDPQFTNYPQRFYRLAPPP